MGLRLAWLVVVIAMVWGCSNAFGHDFGAMKVELASGGPGLVRVTITIDLDHVPSAVRGAYATEIPAKSWVLSGATRLGLGPTLSDEPMLEQGAPASTRRLTFDVAADDVSGGIGWVTEMDVPEYLLMIGKEGDDGRPTQWLSGGRRFVASGLFDLKAGPIERSDAVVGAEYVKLGFTHIVPYGLDHVLFVLTLFLAGGVGTGWKPLLKQVTAFTLAHTVTLALTMFGVVRVPAEIVEPLIAVSILALAVENVLTGRATSHRVGLVFLFGLLHGMGFAGVLTELGLPQSQFVPALVGFNLGVEAGQAAVLAAAFLAVGWFRSKAWYRGAVVVPASVLIASVAGYWTAERVGLL
jgi:hypothetical protein